MISFPGRTKTKALAAIVIDIIGLIISRPATPPSAETKPQAS